MKLPQLDSASHSEEKDPIHIGELVDEVLQLRGIVRNTLQDSQQVFDFGEGLDLEEESDAPNPYADLSNESNDSQTNEVDRSVKNPRDLLKRRYEEAVDDLYPGKKSPSNTDQSDDEKNRGAKLTPQQKVAIKTAREKLRSKKAIVHRQVRNNAARRR